jgi:GntR family transcriptional regulator/MocR family aminotransferase
MSPTPPLALDRTRDEPLYRQIEDQLRTAIRERRLRSGSRVPSIRALARELGVARLTVVTAYEQLVAEGYLVARPGIGTIVAADSRREGRTAAPTTALSRRLGGSLPSIREAIPSRPLGARVGAHGRARAADRAPDAGRSKHPAVIDLRPGAVALDLFPARTWERLIHDVWADLAAAPRADADYPDPAGDPELRAALATFLRETRAIRGGPERVVVTSGTSSAIAAIASLWLEPGRTAVVEEPSSPHVRRTLELTGATVVGVPVDGRGITTDALPPEASLIVVTPAWQFPAGGTLPLARRSRLLGWAAEVGAVVVEDDRESDIRYAPRPVASLQGLDPDGRVIHLGSFSRVLFPGLRTGCAVVPTRFVGRFTAVLETLDRGPAVLEQRALARFIAGGYLDRHLARVRTILRDRQFALLDALDRDLGWLVSSAPADSGIHLAAHIEDDRWTPSRVVDVARSEGILLDMAAGGGPTSGTDRRVLMQYARHDAADIRDGIARLARALAAAGPDPAVGPSTDASAEPTGSAAGVPLEPAGRRVAQP